MKKLLPTIALAFIIQAHLFSQQNYLDTIWSGGMMRTFRVYIPAIYNNQSPTPLVFNFHGLGGNADNFENSTKFRSVADTANFILVTPNGTVNPEFNPNYGQSWSNFDCCPTTDDALFVSNLIDTLVQAFNVDTARIYSAGYSNGGFMGYDLACKLSNRIAAIASVCGSIEVSRLPSCNPTRSVPVLQIHGTNDPIIPFEGGSFIGVTFHAVDTVLKYWVGYDQCSTMPDFSALPNTNTTDGSTVERYVYSSCTDGASVELLKVLNGGHTWPGTAGANTNQDIVAENEIWRFFLKHRLNVVSSTSEKPSTIQVAISPNPASNSLNLTFSSNQNLPSSGSLMIADLFGRMMLERALDVNDFEHPISIDLTSIPVGAYFLVLETTGGGRVFRRFVVVK